MCRAGREAEQLELRRLDVGPQKRKTSSKWYHRATCGNSERKRGSEKKEKKPFVPSQTRIGLLHSARWEKGRKNLEEGLLAGRPR